jgi:hypothetical protein
LSDTVGINSTFRYNANLTDNDIQGDNLAFSRWELYLGARWFL